MKKTLTFLISVVDGKIVKIVEQLTISQGMVHLETNQLTNGTYFYTLILDGQPILSKQMVLAR